MTEPDDGSMLLSPLLVPDGATWSSIGVVCGREIHGGHQSRVFVAERDGEPVVAKLTDGRLVGQAYRRRLEVTAALAEIDESVIAPISIDGARFAELGDWLAAVYPFVAGRTPDVRNETDVRRMASTMASLHSSLDRLEPVDLGVVAALAGRGRSADADGFGVSQLLHGDFSHANLLVSGNDVRVLDFDDCGYGPIEFEIANTLYMVLFDAAMTSDMQRYELFRRWFLDQYRSVTSRGAPDDLVNHAITLRVEALGRWVEQPETAPIGIRTASPAWHEALRAFVRSQSRR